MMPAAGLASSNVLWHLRGLNHRGYIKPRPFYSVRTNTLTPAGLLAAQGYRVLWWEAERVG